VKTLKVYKENGDFVIERINEFNHATKRLFVTEEGFKEGLDAYQPVIDEYEIEATEDVQELVADCLNR
jgi:hypothetical protein